MDKKLSQSELLAANLKRLRARANMNQSDLAEAAELSIGTVKQYEGGDRFPKDLDSLAAALGAEPWELLQPIEKVDKAVAPEETSEEKGAVVSISGKLTGQSATNNHNGESRQVPHSDAQEIAKLVSHTVSSQISKDVIEAIRSELKAATITPAEAEVLKAYRTLESDKDREKVRFLLGLSQSDAAEDETLQSERSLHPTKSSKPKSNK